MRLQDEYLREMEDYTNNLQLNKQFNMFIGKIQDYPNELSRSISVIDKQYNDTENQLSRLLAQRKKKWMKSRTMIKKSMRSKRNVE